MKSEKRYGWNVAHTYGFKPAFLQTCDEGGMLALAGLPGKTELIPEAEAARTIKQLAASDAIAWWDLPEERRWWYEKEMALIANYALRQKKTLPKRS